jgi:hypothetical protein
MSVPGPKAEKLRLSKCLLLFPQQRTFIKATAANSTRIDAARNKPPHPELIDKFADWLIALSSGGLFVFNSNFLRVNDSHRSVGLSSPGIDYPPAQAGRAPIPRRRSQKQSGNASKGRVVLRLIARELTGAPTVAASAHGSRAPLADVV